jgi:uncharacterized protein
VELGITVDGNELPATLTRPPGRARAGVVGLHGADARDRSYFLDKRLADILR